MEAHAVDHEQSGQGEQGGQQNFKRRLGRGLNALLGGGSDENGGPRPATIPMHATSAPPAPASDEIAMELIERNPFQPRREFEQASIDELADSIRKHGILQPLLVRARPDGEVGYQLIAGERRWRAAQQVGIETVPCRVIQFEDRQACEAALEENLKREDLNVLEKAAAFKDYLDRFGGTIEDLGRQLSLNRATVSNMMRLLELPEAIQQLVRENKITGGHAKALLPLSAVQQAELANQIEQDQLSVRRVEEIVRETLRAGTLPLPNGTETTEQGEAPQKPGLSNHVLSLQDFLRGHLGAKIDIKQKKNNAGQIVIHFANSDDFERIVGRLRNAG
ncbi:MAG TPA: ParB/RepB/Spo0J family partition protein [Planctomycetaceae bacterium]|nr:ParB/RepB/Spo0J family partition protein [Planctomycetaceae bacterium]HQZ64701.1 ParB/RepB/Spo0J family partition protein [Planctomycetaceae bacterium]